jgi:hypothetical protein
MGEHGATLIEAVVAVAIVAVVSAAALGVLADLPAAAAAWEEHAAVRQRLRLIDSRVGDVVSAATPIDVEMDGEAVRIPSIWPRRIGLTRADPAGAVSSTAVTVLLRNDGHRLLRLIDRFAGSPVEPRTSAGDGCGADAGCGVRTGDSVLAITASGACGLFRVVSAGTRLRLEALVNPEAEYAAGSVLVPIEIVVLTFDAAEGGIRKYDGYRSDNVMLDGVTEARWIVDGDGALDDGPFRGSGALAYDVDQLRITRVALEAAVARPGGAMRALFDWRPRVWR